MAWESLQWLTPSVLRRVILLQRPYVSLCSHIVLVLRREITAAAVAYEDWAIYTSLVVYMILTCVTQVCKHWSVFMSVVVFTVLTRVTEVWEE